MKPLSSSEQEQKSEAQAPNPENKPGDFIDIPQLRADAGLAGGVPSMNSQTNPMATVTDNPANPLSTGRKNSKGGLTGKGKN